MARYPDIEEALRKTGAALRVRGRSAKTIDTYLRLIHRFLLFHKAVPPTLVEETHLREYMLHLADDRRLSGRSRNQAASALAFYYRAVLEADLEVRLPRARESPSAPVVFSHDEASRVIDNLPGRYHLIGAVLYGSGMRLGECLRIRVKDLDFDLSQITVRNGKGGRDRVTVLPRRLRRPLTEQVRHVRLINESDRTHNGGWAPLPHALYRKDPKAGYALGWQYVFPASRTTADPATGRFGRRHLHPTAVQKQVKRAVTIEGSH